MSFYGNLKNTADRLIREKGQSITFTNTSTQQYDPSAGRREFTAQSQYTVNAVAYPVNLSSTTDDINARYDVRLIAQAATYTRGDTCTYLGKKHTIVDIEPISPGAIDVCYYVDLQA